MSRVPLRPILLTGGVTVVCGLIWFVMDLDAQAPFPRPEPSTVLAPPARKEVLDRPMPRGAPGEAAPARSDSSPPDQPKNIDVALQEHATRAVPRWERVHEILGHSKQADFIELADYVTLRLKEARDQGLEAPYRQELMNEERQLVTTLRARYADFEPLRVELDALDSDLKELEAVPFEPVASPPPGPR